MIIWPGPNVTAFNRAPLLIEDLLLGFELEGVQWRYTNVTGWYLGGVGFRTAFEPYPNAHGAHDAPVYRDPRVIGVEGFLVAETPALGKHACDTLNATLADGRLGTFAIDDPDIGYREAKVRLSGTDGDYWNANQVNKFLLQFTATDPRKYGPLVSAPGATPSKGPEGLTFPLFEPAGTLDFGAGGRSGKVTVDNPGTADTDVVITANGPHLGGVQFTKVGTGERLIFPKDIPSGAELRLDSATGRATLNGADRTGQLTRLEFWKVPAKGSVQVALTPLGPAGQAGTYEVSAQPAYW